VLVIGSGPVIIGHRGVRLRPVPRPAGLREEGIRVVLVNSNPATIMTDDQSAMRSTLNP